MKRLAVLSLAALLFTAGVIGLGGGRAVAAAQAAPTPTQTCVLIIFCTSSSPSPTPSPSASSPGPSPAPSPSATESASPTPTASPSTPGAPQSPTATPSASGSASATPSASDPSATGSATPSGSPSATATDSAGRKKKAAVTPKDASAAAGLVVSNATWTMTVDSATMTNFQYKGNVDLPLAGGGTVTMMEFTVDSMSMSNATTVISEAGQTGTENDASFTASGVTMYATKLSGSLLGVPLTFTPSTASAVLLDVANLVTGVAPLTLTGVTADQAVILAGQAQKTAVGVTG
jgi:hypothetical protein